MTSLVSDLYQYRSLVRALVGRELKVRYRRSILGFVWTMAQPLMVMAVLHAVFSQLFFRAFQMPAYPVYCLTGILFWNFFSQSIVSSMNSLKGNAGLLQKVAVPPAVFPFATVVSGVINLALAMLPLVIILLLTGHPLTPALWFLPVAILLSAIFTFGAGLILSPLAAFFSDIIELIGVLLTLFMYLTPIFYPMRIVPEKYLWLVRFNPIRSLLEVFRDPIYLGKIPPNSHLLVATGIAVGSVAVGAVVFRLASDRIPYYL